MLILLLKFTADDVEIQSLSWMTVYETSDEAGAGEYLTWHDMTTRMLETNWSSHGFVAYDNLFANFSRHSFGRVYYAVIVRDMCWSSVDIEPCRTWIGQQSVLLIDMVRQLSVAVHSITVPCHSFANVCRCILYPRHCLASVLNRVVVSLLMRMEGAAARAVVLLSKLQQHHDLLTVWMCFLQCFGSLWPKCSSFC